MSAEDQPVWRLRDRIETGTLTPAEAKIVSRIVGAVGALNDTTDGAQARVNWAFVRKMLAELTTIKVTVISFGFGHPEGAPEADDVVDLREYRDPHIKPDFRELTGRDQIVRDTVLATPGIRERIDEAIAKARENAHPGKPYVIATGCVGGRHRGYVVAQEIAAALGAELVHRDARKGVLPR